MTHYRLYYMAEETTRIRGFEPIEADDDAAAVEGVRERQRSVAMELWCANWMVKRWALVPESDGDASAAAGRSVIGEDLPANRSSAA